MPLTTHTIGQLALEATLRGVMIGELIAELISTMVKNRTTLITVALFSRAIACLGLNLRRKLQDRHHDHVEIRLVGHREDVPMVEPPIVAVGGVATFAAGCRPSRAAASIAVVMLGAL